MNKPPKEVACFVAKEDFLAFEKLRASGKYQTMQSSEAQIDSGIDRASYSAILVNYTMLKELFGGE